MLDVQFPMFESVPTSRVSEGIANQMMQVILSGKLRPGDKLPTEREMVEQFGTSRVSVREAVRLLEQMGLVEIRRGAGGGTFVVGPEYRPVADSFRVKMQLSHGTVDHLTDARMLLEPGLCRLAAQHADAKDMERLRAVVEEQETLVLQRKEVSSYDLKFHRAIIEASHNPVLALTTVSVIDLVVSALQQARVGGGLTLHVVNFHRAIYNALCERDGERAARLMAEHVADIQSRLRPLLAKSGAVVGWVAGARRGRDPSWDQ